MNKHVMIFLQANQDGGSPLVTFAFIGLMFVVMYFFFIRPQSNRQKNERKFQEELKRGERVVTTSGIHGKIVELSDKSIVLETLAGKIKFEKTAISMELSKSNYSKEA